MRKLYIFAALSLLASTIVSAQEKVIFRATGSGLWSDSRNWEMYSGGIWLPAPENVFPGEAHNREVNVRIDDGSALVITKTDVVHINSLVVGRGNIVVFGDLVIGNSKNEPKDVVDVDIPGDIKAADITADKASSQPQLLQNVPNPVFINLSTQTSFRFYLDKPYEFARIHVFDELGNKIATIFDGQGVTEGWRTITMRTTNLASGSYPVFLELPGNVKRVLMTVVK
jgi:hypothetical protein